VRAPCAARRGVRRPPGSCRQVRRAYWHRAFCRPRVARAHGRNGDLQMNTSASRPYVAYVMTHYPKLAQTFIANEIDALEQAGVQVACFAMNAPDAIERSRAGANERVARTTYLKAAPLRAVSSLLRQTLRHPLA